jgi:hypothetical protein
MIVPPIDAEKPTMKATQQNQAGPPSRKAPAEKHVQKSASRKATDARQWTHGLDNTDVDWNRLASG